MMHRLKFLVRQKLLLGGVAALVVVLAVILSISLPAKKQRSESYKEAPGAAGLDAAITYDCKTRCNYDFNVFIFNDAGQQVGVFRPNKEGKVQVALAEGKYQMLLGKQFGKNTLFPQESLMLKNGKVLELKLRY